MKNLSILLFALIASTNIVSCRPDDVKGGKGGKAVLKITPQHHSVNIDSCKVFIKYDATEEPASYDESVWCVMMDGRPIASFTELKKGNYYLGAEGWDKAKAKVVLGNMRFQITEEKSLEVFLPVDEKGGH